MWIAICKGYFLYLSICNFFPFCDILLKLVWMALRRLGVLLHFLLPSHCGKWIKTELENPINLITATNRFIVVLFIVYS